MPARLLPPRPGLCQELAARWGVGANGIDSELALRLVPLEFLFLHLLRSKEKG